MAYECAKCSIAIQMFPMRNTTGYLHDSVVVPYANIVILQCVFLLWSEICQWLSRNAVEPEKAARARAVNPVGAPQGQKGADEQDKYVINIKQIAKFVVSLGERVAPTDIEEGMRVGYVYISVSTKPQPDNNFVVLIGLSTRSRYPYHRRSMLLSP